MRIIFIVVMSMVSLSASASDALAELTTNMVQDFMAAHSASKVCLVRVSRVSAQNATVTTLSCSGENAAGIELHSYGAKQDVPMIIAMDKLAAAGFKIKVINENLVHASKPQIKGPSTF